jgi:diguanylate cyclase (GGDEF)-like protein
VSAAEGRPAHDLWADPRERRALEEEVHRRGAIEGLRARLRSATGREFRAELAARRLIVEGAPAVLISVRDRSREHEEEARLREQALRDPLTGLFNRRHFLAAGEQAAARGARRLSLAMLDIDHFKRINDRYGHSTGDQVLTLFAGTCEGGLRARDLLARYGGEEFVVLFLDTDSAVARSVCERVRRAVEHLTFPTPDGGTDRFTLSIGVVERQHGESLASLVRRADARLYEAKAAGRNQLAV